MLLLKLIKLHLVTLIQALQLNCNIWFTFLIKADDKVFHQLHGDQLYSDEEGTISDEATDEEEKSHNSPETWELSQEDDWLAARLHQPVSFSRKGSSNIYPILK